MKLTNYLTMDINLLPGLINTALRNDCESLADLVARHDMDEDLLRRRLASAGFVYQEELNQFRPEMTHAESTIVPTEPKGGG